MGTRRIVNHHRARGQGLDLGRMAQNVQRMLEDWGEWEKLDISMAPPEMRLEFGLRNKRCMVFIRSLATEAFQAPHPESGEMEPLQIAHLAIVSHEGLPELTWANLQRIKRELCGAECEGVEVFPRESRDLHHLIERHLWVFPEGYMFPMGMMAQKMSATVDEDGTVALSRATETDADVAPPVTETAQAAVGLSPEEEEQAEETAAADLAALRAELSKKAQE